MPNNNDIHDDAEQLQGKLQDIQQAMSNVEIWAGALAAFSQPIPLDAYHLPRESR